MKGGPKDSTRSRPASDFEETATHPAAPAAAPFRPPSPSDAFYNEETHANREAESLEETGTKTQRQSYDGHEVHEVHEVHEAKGSHEVHEVHEIVEETVTTRREADSNGQILAAPRERTLVMPGSASPATTLASASGVGPVPLPPQQAGLLSRTQPLMPIGSLGPPAHRPPTSPSGAPPSYPPPTGLLRPPSLEAQRRIRTLRILLFLVWVAIVGVTVFTLRLVRELRRHDDKPAPAATQEDRVALPSLSASGVNLLPPVVPAEAPRASATPVASLAPAAPPTASIAPSAPTPRSTPTASAAPSSAPETSTSASPAAVAPVPTSSAPAAAPGAEDGVLVTTQALAGRRVWVDDRLMGQTPEAFTVKCGKHQVRVGTAGKVQNVDVPCGGEVVVK